MVLKEAIMEPVKDMIDYFITEIITKDDNNKLKFIIIFKRRLTNEAMTTFFPSFLLIIISCSTSYFKLPNFFNTAITVNLTVMLTITSLLISIMNKLASTSYIKWIEFWLIFAQLVPFTQVILITGIQFLRDVPIEQDGTLKNEMKNPEQCWSETSQKVYLIIFFKFNKDVLVSLNLHRKKNTK